jgi:4-hydroxybenzoate polyprenyltransferase
MTAYSLTFHHRIGGAGFAKAYVVTMRPYLMFVSGITGIAGLSFVPGIQVVQAALVFLASFLSYGFGQALTDCFQTDTDAISAPYRPLTQGVISTRQVLSISVAGLAGCVAVFSIYHPFNLFLGILAGAGLATYTPFKRRWWSGPFYNAWIVVVLCIMAYFAGGGTVLSRASIDFRMMLISVFFGYANFVLSGYFKDITADRATGYNTLPVVYGRKISTLVSDGFAALTCLPVVTIAVHRHHTPDARIALGFLVLGMLCAIRAQVKLHRVKTDQEAHRAISLVVHSYLLLLAGIAISQKPEWAMSLALFYVLFIFAMAVRPEKNQI